ncbi:MAG: DUF2298 domain-containing protein [Candidatus Dojkabacteria bacterium]
MDVQAFIIWYLTFIVLGIIGLPLANRFFPKWADNGYAFAKFIGLFLVTIPVWFLSSLHILPFTQPILWIVLLAEFAVAVYFIRKQKFKLNKLIVAEELIFLLILGIWAYIRSFNSQIQGTEKFMNLAFMNSILRTEFFPPLDPWFSGGTINYYYLGHYMYSFLAKLLSMGMGLVYSLALVTIIAQTFVSLFSIFVKLSEKMQPKFRYGLAILGSFWITFGANMHYAFYWLESVLTGSEFQYFFPNPTRIIPFTINEFPSYSIVLGDLHGHYLAIPYLILALALVFTALKIKIDTKEKIWFNIMISSFVMVLYGINSWDVITVNYIFLVVHLFQAWKMKGDRTKRFAAFIKAEVALIVPGLILMLPYLFEFSPAVGGLGLVPLDKKSAVGPWLLMWGMFLVITLFYAGFVWRKKLKKPKQLYPVLMFFIAASLVIGVEVFFLKDIFYSSNNDYFRTNTVFKFYYHAWIIWGIAATGFTYVILGKYLKDKSRAMLVSMMLIVVFFIGSAAYIFKAVKDFYPFETPKIVSLDGTAYLDIDNKADYEAIRWINENIEGQPVFVEEVGEAYTYSSRISAHTGVPAVLGWPTHEWQWRGDPTIVFDRADKVRAFYTAVDEATLSSFTEEFNVEYVFVGDKEREQYGEVSEELFDQNFEKIYDNLNVRIYKVN